MSVQGGNSIDHGVAYAGMTVDGQLTNTVSKLNKNASAIPWGTGVVTSGDTGADFPTSLSTASQFIGVVKRELNRGQPNAVTKYDMTVVTLGPVYVLPVADVVINDPVYMLPGGTFSNTGALLIPFAKWMSTSRAGTPAKMYIGSRTAAISSPPLGILRFASAENRYLNYPLAPNFNYVMTNCSRYGRHIGSGDRNELRLVTNNNYLWLGTVENPGNTKTIVNTFIEIPGKTSVRCTWNGGANGLTEADGAYDTVSDPVLPSQFGMTVFPIGMQFFIRTECTIPALGRLCTTENWDTDDAAGHVFDNTTVQCTNISGSGDLTYTGGVLFASQSFTPLVVGKFVSGDPRVALGVGDSVVNGVGDTPTGMGRGFFSRACIGTDWTTSIAGCNASRSSGNAQAWTSAPALNALAKYANVLVEEYGTNNFDNGANADPSTVNYVVGLSRNIWTLCVANASAVVGATAYRVIRTKLLPRTNTPTGPLVTDQVVYGAKWDTGGNVDDFNSQVAADPQVNTFVSFDAITRAASPNQHKWLSGLLSTADGTHPNDSPGHIQMGTQLRAAITA